MLSLCNKVVAFEWWKRKWYLRANFKRFCQRPVRHFQQRLLNIVVHRTRQRLKLSPFVSCLGMFWKLSASFGFQYSIGYLASNWRHLICTSILPSSSFFFFFSGVGEPLTFMYVHVNTIMSIPWMKLTPFGNDF